MLHAFSGGNGKVQVPCGNKGGKYHQCPSPKQAAGFIVGGTHAVLPKKVSQAPKTHEYGKNTKADVFLAFAVFGKHKNGKGNAGQEIDKSRDGVEVENHSLILP